MNTEVKPLPEETRKNGMTYKLIKKGAKAAIYQATASDVKGVIAYETIKIKVTPAREMFGTPMPAFETFPGNEMFGLWAWCFGTGGGEKQALEKAEARFQEIEDGTFNQEEPEHETETISKEEE